MKETQQKKSATVLKYMSTSFHTDNKATERESTHFIFTIVTKLAEHSQDNSWIDGLHRSPTPISSVLSLRSTVWLSPAKWLKRTTFVTLESFSVAKEVQFFTVF